MQSVDTHSVDVLAFSPHPDDAEMGCGGTLAMLASRGYRVAIVDLTRGERASQGSPEQRALEAEKAGELLKLSSRHNLCLPDSALLSQDEAARNAVVTCVRKMSPRLVLYPLDDLRHPDHREAQSLVCDAVFLAGLTRYPCEGNLPAISPPQLVGYPTRSYFRPDFVVNVSSHYEQKLAAIKAYQSQIQAPGTAHVSLMSASPVPLISSPLTLPAIESRDTLWGAMVGVARAEGYKLRSPMRIDDPIAHFQTSPLTGALLFPE